MEQPCVTLWPVLVDQLPAVQGQPVWSCLQALNKNKKMNNGVHGRQVLPPGYYSQELNNLNPHKPHPTTHLIL